MATIIFLIILGSFIVHCDDYTIRQKKIYSETKRINRAERIRMRTFNNNDNERFSSMFDLQTD